MQIKIPANAYPGMVMNVALSDGRTVALAVPPGAPPGSLIAFDVPSASPPLQRPVSQSSNTGFNGSAAGQQPMVMKRSNTNASHKNGFNLLPATRSAPVSPTPVELAYARAREQERREADALNATGDAKGIRPEFASGLYRIYSCCTTDFMQSLSPLQLWCAVGCCGCSSNNAIGSAVGLMPCCSSVLYMVGEDEVGVVERLGKFQKIVTAGPVVLSSPCLVDVEKLTTRLPLRLMQRVVKVDTKTKDNVFCAVEVSVQYRMGGADLIQAAECAAYKAENFVEMLSDQVRF